MRKDKFFDPQIKARLGRIAALTVKENAWYFNNVGGFSLMSFFAGLTSFLFFKDFFLIGNASLRGYFAVTPWLLIFLVSSLSMRTFSEEKRTGTLEVLLSLPISEGEVIAGKFLGALGVILFSLFASLTIPVSVFFLGKIDLGGFVAGGAGLILLAAAMLAVGLFISTLTKNPVVSLVGTILILFFLIVLGDDLVLQQTPKFLGEIFSFLSFTARLKNFTSGLIDLSDTVFFLSFIGGFLFLSVKITENRS